MDGLRRRVRHGCLPSRGACPGRDAAASEARALIVRVATAVGGKTLLSPRTGIAVRRVRCALRRWRADIAKVAEVVDDPALGDGAARRGGSSPPFRTTQRAGSAPRSRSPCSGLETVCPVSSYLA